LKNTFTREERLRSRKAIESLIKEGTTYFSYPLRITWKITSYPQQYPIQIAFAVPKKRYKRAVKRNRIKRLLRETHRLNKHTIYAFLAEKNINLNILVVYIGEDILPYHDIDKKMRGFHRHLMEQLQKTA
jgi:ribonuclease P protein component